MHFSCLIYSLCSVVSSDSGSRLSVRTRVPIKAGSLISISYLPFTYQPALQRDITLWQNYAIACKCTLCTVDFDRVRVFKCEQCAKG